MVYKLPLEAMLYCYFCNCTNHNTSCITQHTLNERNCRNIYERFFIPPVARRTSSLPPALRVQHAQSIPEPAAATARAPLVPHGASDYPCASVRGSPCVRDALLSFAGLTPSGPVPQRTAEFVCMPSECYCLWFRAPASRHQRYHL